MNNKRIARELVKIAKALTAGISIGQTVETKTLRIHRYTSSYEIQDLENAGKRGKKVNELVIYNIDRNNTDTAKELVEGLGSRLLKARNYKDAKKIVEWAADELRFAGDPFVEVIETQLRGVDVTPAGFKPLKIKGRHVLIESDYKTFSVRDLDDVYNEETCIPSARGKKRSVKLMYRWVTDNENRIKNMTFYDVIEGMNKNGIDYHQYCAMD